MRKNSIFPFTAIIGQEKLKKALILNVINPKIGGVLICGEKGTAKSTAVRGLAKIMDGMEVVDLPLNVTEDRLIGGVNIESAIKKGVRELEGGILKKANNNILYVDEVNLLSEHIVNCILGASGTNRIEREGLSEEHPCNFILVGTMNPEEGALRSQFLDRFGLYVEVTSCGSVADRVEIIKRRMEFEKDSYGYEELWCDEQNILREKINNARKKLESVQVKEQALNLAAQLASKANCDGHRGELVLIETAKAIAAMDNRRYVNVEDLKEASELALPHRMKEAPMEPPQDENKDDKQEGNEEENSEDNKNGDNPEKNPDEQLSHDEEDTENKEDDQNDDSNDTEENEREENDHENSGVDDLTEEIFDIGKVFKVKKLNIKVRDRKKRAGSGKRTKTKTNALQGRYIRYKECRGAVRDLAFDATIRAAAPYQKFREHSGNTCICIKEQDIKEKVREKRTGATIVFVVDASSSMGVNQRMKAVKGAIMSLLTDAYEKRDKVGMVAFRKDKAEVLLDVTRSVEMAQRQLKVMPTGGKTPLGFGIEKAYELFKKCEKKDKDIVPVMVLVSDGRVNYHGKSSDPFEDTLKIAHEIQDKNIQSIVIDCEQGFVKLGMAKEISEALDADYYKIDDLKADEIANAVRNIV
ncbi:magnesium chelatase subunit D [Hathewaya proteolytica DSM 3090]|uniref:Magnesium chelatase subunit D n=1 Tax=Hathewaya proteolytica DSM 3090 TaxID=1121331 RepID=A0A1M6KMW7_9CLOT|nr:magnesium chelatase subunit D family protein [Hathewaya proteolytica]SHJ60303.1 magnesium chelatase subunit D [Hathewaya proteolytica DSM 3090]